MNVKVEEYGWGQLMVLEEGHSFKCIMHTEHINDVLRVVEGEVNNFVFTDEQCVFWTARLSGSNLVISNLIPQKFILPVQEFKDRLGIEGAVDLSDLHSINDTVTYREQ